MAAAPFVSPFSAARATEASEINSDVIELLESQANAFFANREFPQAIEMLDRLVDLQPRSPRWREFRGAVKTDFKDFAGALADYQDAFRLIDSQGLGKLSDRDRARLFSGRALVYEGLSEWESALRDYDQAQELALQAGFSADPYLINSRGNVLASLGRWKEAREEYLAASEIFQGSKGFRGRNGGTTQRLDGAIFSASNAALALAQLGDEQGAFKEIDRLVRRAPGSVDMRAAQAALLYSRGETERAEETWEFACNAIKVGCLNYRDPDWLVRVRRWPPVMAQRMNEFLSLAKPARLP